MVVLPVLANLFLKLRWKKNYSYKIFDVHGVLEYLIPFKTA